MERTVKEMDIEEVFKYCSCPYFKFCKWRYEGPGRENRLKHIPGKILKSQRQSYNNEYG